MVYFGENRIHCAEVDSTNEELKRLFSKKELENGTLLTTDFQTRGKGQMGAHWESSHGENFLGSFFLKPSIPVGEVFVLNMIVSLALRETVCEFLKGAVEIKWPNDIVVNGNKIAGVLIENKFSNSHLSGSFLGVGLNINQKSFEKFKRSGTSIAKELGISVNKESVTSRLCFHIQQFYSLYQLKGYETISFIYHQDLYLKGEEHEYKVGKDTRCLTLQYVNKQGNLQLFNQFGKIEEFTLKEVQFLL